MLCSITMYKYITVIHSIVDRHLDCFQLGAFMNNTSMNKQSGTCLWCHI